MSRDRTTQEQLWDGPFGDQYIERTRGPEWFARNVSLFSRILESAGPVDSVLELGANIGLNLHALRSLLPTAAQTAVEINAKAVSALRALPNVTVHHGSILDYKAAHQVDLAFTKTVLIHIAPERLPQVYDVLHASARKYVLLIEYYSPAPVEVSYRGHAGQLFKRDFAGEMLARFPDLKLRDYGFRYRRDVLFPQDDVTWFLLEKRSQS